MPKPIRERWISGHDTRREAEDACAIMAATLKKRRLTKAFGVKVEPYQGRLWVALYYYPDCFKSE
jgi:hypothetical protein